MLILDRQLGETIYINGFVFELLDIGNNSVEIEFDGKNISMDMNKPIMIENTESALIKIMETVNFKTKLKEYTARFGFIGNDNIVRGKHNKQES